MQIILIEDSSARAIEIAKRVARTPHPIELLQLNFEFRTEPPGELECLPESGRRFFSRPPDAAKTAEVASKILSDHGAEEDILLLVDTKLGGSPDHTAIKIAAPIRGLIDHCRSNSRFAWAHVYSNSPDLSALIAAGIGNSYCSEYPHAYAETEEGTDDLIRSALDDFGRARQEHERARKPRSVYERVWPASAMNFFDDTHAQESGVPHTWEHVFDHSPSLEDIQLWSEDAAFSSKQGKYIKSIRSYLAGLLNWSSDDVPAVWFQNRGLHEALKSLVGRHSKAHVGYRFHRLRQKVEMDRLYDLRVGAIALLLAASSSATRNEWLRAVPAWPVAQRGSMVPPQTTRQSLETVRAFVEEDQSKGLFFELRLENAEDAAMSLVESITLEPGNLLINFRLSMSGTDGIKERNLYETDKEGGNMLAALRRANDAMARGRDGSLTQKCRICLFPLGESNTALQFVSNFISMGPTRDETAGP
jgi:hypothetical protein